MKRIGGVENAVRLTLNALNLPFFASLADNDAQYSVGVIGTLLRYSIQKE
jgi:hypothetical protein